jgi:hypothetical protein
LAKISEAAIEASAKELIRLVTVGLLRAEDVPKLIGYGIAPEVIEVCLPYLKMKRSLE